MKDSHRATVRLVGGAVCTGYWIADCVLEISGEGIEVKVGDVIEVNGLKWNVSGRRMTMTRAPGTPIAAAKHFHEARRTAEVHIRLDLDATGR